MAKCKYGQKGVCDKLYHPNCPDNSECYEYELFTNAERIRAMSDEELAQFIEDQRVCQICHRRMNNCFPGDVFQWLQQPATEEGEQNV